jgi:GTP-binding protein LepA
MACFGRLPEKLNRHQLHHHTVMDLIRNFCIIAHIDHGKSTLADRMLEFTNTIQVTEGQMLDDMDLERERGITIKSHAIQMEYEMEGKKYLLNLIDTPGHVDFSYEVSRSIAACEGALLVVDATQGVQAQTISNLYMAIDQNLEIIPVINKIDMPSAMPDEVEDEIIELLGCDREDIIRASGKTGEGVEDILKAVVNRIPHPEGDPNAPLQALIFDSVFNSFRGIIAYFKITNGSIRKGDKVKFFNTGMEYDADEVGVLKMDMLPRPVMNTGEVGYIISGIKDAKEVKVGDTITHVARPCDKAIEGFQEVKPMVFAGVYPIDPNDYENLRSSLEKLQLNDASLTFFPESSVALGFGFRCGFLGLLHMEIIQERLDREFDMDVITTVPNVSYIVYDKQGSSKEVHNPSGLPDQTLIDHIEEPYIKASVITTTNFIGPIMKLCLDKRGELINQEFVSGNRVEIHFYLPLGEIVIDFYDKLKSISKGYASFDYYICGYRPSKLAKLDILLNGEPVDALSTLTHQDNAVAFGRRMCEKLKELIPRQQFDIAIQAAIGAKIIARETVKCVRKDVTAKCYGGDVSRKRKLLEKQKKGKKRMKQIGNVEVPQKAFLAVLKLD